MCGCACAAAVHISGRRRRGNGSGWRTRQAALLEPVHVDRRPVERRDAADQQGLDVLRRTLPRAQVARRRRRRGRGGRAALRRRPGRRRLSRRRTIAIVVRRIFAIRRRKSTEVYEFARNSVRVTCREWAFSSTTKSSQQLTYTLSSG